MYAFMAMKAIEMVKMVLRTKAKLKNSCQKWTAFKMIILREWLELLTRQNNQMKACSISFLMTFTFMAMRAIEMVKMAFQQIRSRKKVDQFIKHYNLHITGPDNFFFGSIFFERACRPFVWLAWPWKYTPLERKLNISFGCILIAISWEVC
jgi:hypothetical protein